MNIATIEHLVQRVANSQVQQVTVTDGGQSITVTNRLGSAAVSTATQQQATDNLTNQAERARAEEALKAKKATTQNEASTVTSTYVGYIQLNADTGSDPLVKVGDMIEVGQTIAYVDVLSKLLPIESKLAGDVAEVLVKNGDAVAYAQAIIKLA